MYVHTHTHTQSEWASVLLDMSHLTVLQIVIRCLLLPGTQHTFGATDICTHIHQGSCHLCSNWNRQTLFKQLKYENIKSIQYYWKNRAIWLNLGMGKRREMKFCGGVMENKLLEQIFEERTTCRHVEKVFSVKSKRESKVPPTIALLACFRLQWDLALFYLFVCLFV